MQRRWKCSYISALGTERKQLKYFKHIWEEDQVINLVELDEELICHRAIFIENNDTYTTNVVSKQDKFFLPEGSFEGVIDQLEEISSGEFISAWSLANKDLALNLERIKSDFRIGKLVKARVICFYPQGVIFDCDDSFNGIAKYDDCLAEFGQAKMYPDVWFDLIVSGIDQENLMIQLQTLTTYAKT